MSGAPKIDRRSAGDVTARLVALLPQHTRHPAEPAQRYPFPAWHEYDAASGAPVGRSAALIGIFARFSELVIERLNRVPDKNLLAFLDLLGAAQRPPQPARAPLTFTLSAGSTLDAQVPQGTRVTAPAGPDGGEPLVFETERPLVVTAARLSALLTLDPSRDAYGDWSERLSAPAAFTVFQGERALEHVLYLGDSQLLGYADIKNLRVHITLEAPLPADAEPRQVQWESWDGAQWRPLHTVEDPSAGLTQPGTIHFGPVQPMPETTVDARASRWLRCRLLTPITQSPARVAGMVRASRLPRVKEIGLAVHLERTSANGLAPDRGFANTSALDPSKDFSPFGDKPALHDTLFLASAVAFSKDRTASSSASSARIDLDVQVANSHLLAEPGTVRPSADIALVWECWNGGTWQKVGTSAAPPWLRPIELEAVAATVLTPGESMIVQGSAPVGARLFIGELQGDGLLGGFRTLGADGRFAEKLDSLAAGLHRREYQATFQGQTSRAWVAVFVGTPTVELTVTPPAAPVDAASAILGIALGGSGAGPVDTLRIRNGAIAAAPVTVARAAQVTVNLVEGRNDLLIEALAGATVLAAKALTVMRLPAAPAPDAAGFSDGTFAFTKSGVVTLHLPDAMAATAVNGEENFWLRVRLVKGDYGKDAGYALKTLSQPEDGFTLVPANLRPPIVAAVKIGYELTPRRAPQTCLTYNELVFADRTAAAGPDTAAFAPFDADSETPRPALYAGFSLPPERSSFPNTTISLYQRVLEPKYGERAVPLSPASSRRSGAPGSVVTHAFTITNTSAQQADFDIAVLGGIWTATAPAAVSVEPGASVDLAVQIHIPVTAQAGQRDSGFVRIAAGGEPGVFHEAALATAVGNASAPERPSVAWQYWNGARWSRLTLEDGSENFTRSGLVELVAPADFAPRELFGRGGYWLRAELEKGEYTEQPRLARMLLNTTLALQTTTFVNEILGSSNGTARQQFRAAGVPVLAGPRLEVREPEIPGAAERAALEAEEGADAISVLADAAGEPREIWVRWHEVTDFYGSGAGDRHYVLNHLSGEIVFGDGLNGRIPPRGTGNLRLSSYQTGGGRDGNLAAGAIAQLASNVPYVEQASNPEPAAGGADAETPDELIARVPRTLRHRDRAVTLEDYEDLALLASSEVLRARCIPLRDLAADPLGAGETPGAVSVIAVPRTEDAKPLPTAELLARVRDFLQPRADATAALSVVGPLYIRVDVQAEIAVAAIEGASAVDRAVRARLAAFLHPLTGGLDGNGWDFGRAPHRSDLFALLEAVPGVDHVRYLQVEETQDQPGVRDTGRFLVFSGAHQISLVFEET